MIKSILGRFFISISLIVLTISPVFAQAASKPTEEEPAVELDRLGDLLSCRSHDAALYFAKLFLQSNPPAWVHKVEDPISATGMINFYGYQLDKPALLRDQLVDNVYFFKDWVITLWPREKALAFIASQKMQRVPVKLTEQYYRFIRTETGPMLGAFKPTRNTVIHMLEKAYGSESPKRKIPDNVMFVGCNYSLVSQKDFLAIASRREEIVKNLAKKFHENINESQ